MKRVCNAILFPHSMGQKNSTVVENTPYLFYKHIYPDVNKNIVTSPSTNSCYHNIERLYRHTRFLSFPKCTIGGDHSMSIATVANTIKHYPDSKILWFDAHADINSPESSYTKNIHGMPLHFLKKSSEHTKYIIDTNKIDYSNLMYIGLRDVDPYEKYIIDKYDIRYIEPKEINEEKFSRVMDFVKDHPIHLSFDVDVIDNFSSTKTPVYGGIKTKPLKKILRELIDKKNVVNTDITEFYPCNNRSDIDTIVSLFPNIFSPKETYS